MKKRIINGIEFSQGSKNIFADLGLPDADKLKIKTDLVIQIIKALERLHLTQAEAVWEYHSPKYQQWLMVISPTCLSESWWIA